MKIKIENRYTGNTLFECEAPEGMSTGLQMRHAMEKAVSDGANLSGADLSGANLSGANLSGADLSGANLDGAYLTRANLAGASLAGASLDGAYLDGAYLDGGAKLLGERPVFQLGPIGSRCDYFVAYITDHGLRFDAGCQRQITREVFEQRLAELHGDNKHAREYRAALALIDLRAELWTKK